MIFPKDGHAPRGGYPWQPITPWQYPPYQPCIPPDLPSPQPLPTKDDYTRNEIKKLRKEMKELIKLLKQAKEFDKNTDQPDCEISDKVDFIKQLAKFVDVDLDDVFEDMKTKEK